MITFFIRKLPQSIFDSQVLQYAIGLSYHGVKDINIIVPSKINYQKYKEKYCINFVLIDDTKKIRYLLSKSKIVYIRDLNSYCYYYGRFSYLVGFPKLFYDFRGLISEESYLRNKSLIRFYLLRLMEFLAYKNCKYVSCVSNNLKLFLIKKFGEKKNLSVLPCCVEANYEKTRTDLLSIKFVYLGGLSKWQCFDKIISLYKSITYIYDNTQLYIITRETTNAQKILEKENIPNVEIRAMAHANVLEFLKSMDFGFLLREDILLNNVASPIKFMEYAAMGVVPIVSKGVGDYSSFVEEKKIGILLNDQYSCSHELINSYLKDKQLYNRLYQFTNDYVWKNALKDAVLTKLAL